MATAETVARQEDGRLGKRVVFAIVGLLGAYGLIVQGGVWADQAMTAVRYFGSMQVGDRKVSYIRWAPVTGVLKHLPALNKTGQTKVTITSAGSLEVKLEDSTNNGTFNCITAQITPEEAPEPGLAGTYRFCTGNGHVDNGDGMVRNKQLVDTMEGKLVYWVDWLNNNAFALGKSQK